MILVESFGKANSVRVVPRINLSDSKADEVLTEWDVQVCYLLPNKTIRKQWQSITRFTDEESADEYANKLKDMIHKQSKSQSL